MSEEMPPLVSASDLVVDEEEIPPEPGPAIDGERHGPFIVQKRAGYGDGWRDWILRDDIDAMEAVGIYVARELPDLNGPDLAAKLVSMGLPEKRAVTYGRQRQQMLDTRVDDHPAVEKLVVEEQKHYARKDEFSKAFVAAQNRKGATK